MPLSRLIVTTVVGGSVAILLVGCTPPTPFGARLNADDTVDFVLCHTSPAAVEVNYWVGDEVESPKEWVAEIGNLANTERVVRFGSSIYESTVLKTPPPTWTYVELNTIGVWRSQLTAGEWVWFTEPLAFMPDPPCSSVSEAELAQ